jgi:hypothetical protein
MDWPRFSRQEVAFLLGVPLAWAVLLLFHPAVDDPVYDSLVDDADAFFVVHVGMLFFIGLIGAALYLLVRDLPGMPAKVDRWAIVPFILLYAAGEAVLGIATGVIVQEGVDAPVSEQEGIAASAQALWDNFVAGDLLIALGGIAWIVAIIGAVVAYKRLGASMGILILLGLSAFVAGHDPPIGPIALLCFAGAVVLIVRAERAPAVQTPAVSGEA